MLLLGVKTPKIFRALRAQSSKFPKFLQIFACGAIREGGFPKFSKQKSEFGWGGFQNFRPRPNLGWGGFQRGGGFKAIPLVLYHYLIS